MKITLLAFAVLLSTSSFAKNLTDILLTPTTYELVKGDSEHCMATTGFYPLEGITVDVERFLLWGHSLENQPEIRRIGPLENAIKTSEFDDMDGRFLYVGKYKSDRDSYTSSELFFPLTDSDYFKLEESGELSRPGVWDFLDSSWTVSPKSKIVSKVQKNKKWVMKRSSEVRVISSNAISVTVIEDVHEDYHKEYGRDYSFTCIYKSAEEFQIREEGSEEDMYL